MAQESGACLLLLTSVLGKVEVLGGQGCWLPALVVGVGATPIVFSGVYWEVSLSRKARVHLMTWSWRLSGLSFPICSMGLMALKGRIRDPN